MEGYLEDLNELLTAAFDNLDKIERHTLRESRINATISEVHFIEAIGKRESTTVSQIATDLGITSASVTLAVNKLVGKKYVTKQVNESDRRSAFISLTREGKRVYRLHNYFHRRLIRSMTEGMSREEITILHGAVNRLNEFLKESASFRRRKP